MEVSSQLKASCFTPEEIALVSRWMPGSVGFGKQKGPWIELRFCVCPFLNLFWEYNVRFLTNITYTWSISACAGILSNHALVSIVFARSFPYILMLCCVREVKQLVTNASVQLPWRCYLILPHQFINFGFVTFCTKSINFNLSVFTF